MFHFYSNLDRTICKHAVRSAASGLGLHCLPTSHKKDARLIWVNGARVVPMSLIAEKFFNKTQICLFSSRQLS